MLIANKIIEDVSHERRMYHNRRTMGNYLYFPLIPKSSIYQTCTEDDLLCQFPDLVAIDDSKRKSGLNTS